MDPPVDTLASLSLHAKHRAQVKKSEETIGGLVAQTKMLNTEKEELQSSVQQLEDRATERANAAIHASNLLTECQQALAVQVAVVEELRRGKEFRALEVDAYYNQRLIAAKQAGAKRAWNGTTRTIRRLEDKLTLLASQVSNVCAGKQQLEECSIRLSSQLTDALAGSNMLGKHDLLMTEYRLTKDQLTEARTDLVKLENRWIDKWNGQCGEVSRLGDELQAVNQRQEQDRKVLDDQVSELSRVRDAQSTTIEQLQGELEASQGLVGKLRTDIVEAEAHIDRLNVAQSRTVNHYEQQGRIVISLGQDQQRRRRVAENETARLQGLLEQTTQLRDQQANELQGLRHRDAGWTTAEQSHRENLAAKQAEIQQLQATIE